MLQPLAWLALAAIVFAGALPPRKPSDRPRGAPARGGDPPLAARPRPVRMLGESLSGGFRERWEPIATALSLIWRNGPGRSWASTSWRSRVVIVGHRMAGIGLIYDLLGPHEIGWWMATNEPIDLLIERYRCPLQIVPGGRGLRPQPRAASTSRSSVQMQN